jgi:hypothetical protein
MSAFDDIVLGYESKRNGEHSFVKLSHQEAAKISNRASRLAKAIQWSGTAAAIFALPLAIGARLSSGSWGFLSNLSPDSPVVVMLVAGLVCNASYIFLELNKVANHMLRMGERPVNKVTGLLPAVPQADLVIRRLQFSEAKPK